jgi:hypothetical protein
MGPRYSQITGNDGLLEKVGTNLVVLHGIEVSDFIII